MEQDFVEESRYVSDQIAVMFNKASDAVEAVAEEINSTKKLLTSKSFFDKINKRIRTELDTIFGMNTRPFIQITVRLDLDNYGSVNVGFKDAASMAQMRKYLENRLAAEEAARG